eukprot:SAG11_NODE_682_length_7769_cov_45.167275_5_plen_171_part_00
MPRFARVGNSIYRSLNQALRVEHQNVPKYLGYLRLFFDAAVRLFTACPSAHHSIMLHTSDRFQITFSRHILHHHFSSATHDRPLPERMILMRYRVFVFDVSAELHEADTGAAVARYCRRSIRRVRAGQRDRMVERQLVHRGGEREFATARFFSGLHCHSLSMMISCAAAV